MAEQISAVYKRRRIPAPLRAEVWDRSDGTCHLCGVELHPLRNFHVDHLIPMACGGTDDLENLAACCASCNLSKGARVPARCRRRTRRGNAERYFTGIPCKNGHIAERLSSNRECVERTRERLLAKYRSGGQALQEKRARYLSKPEVRERRRSQDKARREGKREEINSRRRELWAQNQERGRERLRQRYWEQHESELARRREWYRKNADAVRARHANQAAEKHQVTERITEADVESVFERDGRVCLACNTVERVEIDHVVPLSLGGRNHPDNLQPLCRRCNASKGARSIDYRKDNEAAA